MATALLASSIRFLRVGARAEISHAAQLMSFPKRDLAVLGMFGAALLSLTDCSLLTKVDWSVVPPEQANGGASGGDTSAAGASDEAGQGGLTGAAGASGEAGAEAGAGGEAGEGGSPAETQGGFGGTLGGSGGSGGTGGPSGGKGGGPATAGSAGTGGGSVGHPTCKVAPTPPATSPDLSQSLVFFDGGTGANGDRTNGSPTAREGLNKTCEAAKTALHLPHSMAVAVISVDFEDQIYKMPEKYRIPREGAKIVSPLNVELAPSWNSLWLGAAPPSLVCTGVMPVGSQRWLTGSTSAKAMPPGDQDPAHSYYGVWDSTSDMFGNAYNNACNGWTQGAFDPATKAHTGSTTAHHDGGSTEMRPRFIDYVLVECDAVKDDHVLCIAFNPTP